MKNQSVSVLKDSLSCLPFSSPHFIPSVTKCDGFYRSRGHTLTKGMNVKRRQLKFQHLKSSNSAYGGVLRNTRKGRSGPRPLAVRHSMHLVLRSSLAKGEWSFRKPKNAKKIDLIIQKFSTKYGVSIHSMANVGNHLHLHIGLGTRYAYTPFIRAITSAIAMAVTGRTRWTNAHQNGSAGRAERKRRTSGLSKPTDYENQTPMIGETNQFKRQKQFWDHRPFTRIVFGMTAFKRLVKYIKINQLEGLGHSRHSAEFWIHCGAYDFGFGTAVDSG